MVVNRVDEAWWISHSQSFYTVFRNYCAVEFHSKKKSCKESILHQKTTLHMIKITSIQWGLKGIDGEQGRIPVRTKTGSEELTTVCGSTLTILAVLIMGV